VGSLHPARQIKFWRSTANPTFDCRERNRRHNSRQHSHCFASLVEETSLAKEATMKRTKCLVGLFAILLFIPAGVQAQVKSIEMKLVGRLCRMCSFNIRKAVSLFDFGPRPEEVKITDEPRAFSKLS
jgi:hypothetical protein